MRWMDVRRATELLLPGQGTGVYGLGTVKDTGMLFLEKLGDLTGVHLAGREIIPLRVLALALRGWHRVALPTPVETPPVPPLSCFAPWRWQSRRPRDRARPS